MKILSLTVLPILFCIALGGCQTSNERAENVKAAINQPSDLSVSAAQTSIQNGMSGAEVIEALGTPNIITTDREGREVWTYDKVSTQTISSYSSGGAQGLLLAGVVFGNAALGTGGSVGQSSGASGSSTSSKSLTIIVKFSKDKLVRDLAYRYSNY
jgi:outer membrane protein assembly factor BamE (lipoprotein component of BamABCDE complex)